MEEEIRVDFDAWAEEVKNNAKESGFLIKAYMPVVEGEDFFSGAGFAPIVEIEGTSNAVMSALMVSALEETIKTLLSDKNTHEAYKFLKKYGTMQTAVNNRKEKDNE